MVTLTSKSVTFGLSAFVGNANSSFTVITGDHSTPTSPLILSGVTLKSYNFDAGACEATYTLTSSALSSSFTIAEMLAGVIEDTLATPSLGRLVIREPLFNGKAIVDLDTDYKGAFITPTSVGLNAGTAGQIDIEFTTASSPLGICSLYFNIPVRAFSAGGNLWFIRPGIDIVNIDSGSNSTGAGILISNGTPSVGSDLLIIVN
jgi:hypothetical protein